MKVTKVNLDLKTSHGASWGDKQSDIRDDVETVQLRDGLSLILSDISTGEVCPYHYVEPEDYFGIGFHLKGGSRFQMEGTSFNTKPLEVYAGIAPRSSTSTFILPASGFRTVSLRFSPDAAADMLDRHVPDDEDLIRMVKRAGSDVEARRLAPLDPAAAETICRMFDNPYSGSGRILYLESCVLGLLAAQFEAVGRAKNGQSAPGRSLLDAKAYIDAHLTDPPTIIQLARICGINDFKLKRDFKAAFGTTIFGYVRQRRMEQAVVDLRAGLSVTQSAMKAGYQCPRCFSDAFRQHFGVLPSNMKRDLVLETPARYG